MSETIRVGQVWRDYSGDYLILGRGREAGLWAAVMPKTGTGGITLWRPFFEKATLVTDAPAPTPAPEKPEVGRWMRHDRASAVHFAYVIPGVDEHPLWTDDGRCLGAKSANMASAFWSPCDPPPWAAEALARAGIVPLPVVKVSDAAIEKLKTPPMRMVPGDIEEYPKPTPQPRLIPTECVRCGLRIKVAEAAFSVAGNNRCETCGEQYAKRMAAERYAKDRRKEDEETADKMLNRAHESRADGIRAGMTRLYERLRIAKESERFPHDDAFAISGRAAMVGGIVRVR